MKTSSSELIRPLESSGELRTGTWTRLGDAAVLGDKVTEHTLSALAESTRTAARAQGYATGWAEGRRTAEEAAREEAARVAEAIAETEHRREIEHRAAVDALMRAAAALQGRVAEVAASVEDQAVDAAMAVARAVIGRELAVAESPGTDAVRRALTLMPQDAMVRVRLHPADLPSVDLPGVALVADPTLGRGDAVAEALDHVVDARLSTALQRAEEVLRG